MFSWIPRGRALPPEVWAARHRGLLLVLAAHLMVLPAFAVTQGWSLRRRGRSTSPPAARRRRVLRRLRPTVRSSLCANGAADLLRGARRRLARHDRSALPLLRDGRRPRALPGVVDLPAGDRLRRPAARRDRRGAGRDRLPARPQPVEVGGDPRRFVAALAVANMVTWRESERIRGATALRGTLQARVRRRAGRDRPRLPAWAGAEGQPRAARAHRPRAPEGLLLLGLRARARPRRAARELAAGARRARGGAPLRARRRLDRLVPVAPLADPRRGRPARPLRLPGRRHHRPQARRRAPRPPGPPRPADRAAQPRALRPLLADALERRASRRRSR